MSSNEALKLLQDVGVPCSRINFLSEVVTDPQVEARKAIVDYQHPVAGVFRGVGAPWRLASDPEDRQARTSGPAARRTRPRDPHRDRAGRKAIDELAEGEVVWVP